MKRYVAMEGGRCIGFVEFKEEDRPSPEDMAYIKDFLRKMKRSPDLDELLQQPPTATVVNKRKKRSN